MTTILRNGRRLLLLKSEQIALPRFAREVTTEVSGLAFTLRFESDGSSVPNVLTLDTGSIQSVVLRFMNFNSPTGTAFDADVGTVEGANLLLSVMVHAIAPDRTPPVDFARNVTISFFKELGLG